jgi:hypothetical protein
LGHIIFATVANPSLAAFDEEFVPDSPLEGAVYCELVSERVLGKLGSDFR